MNISPVSFGTLYRDHSRRLKEAMEAVPGADKHISEIEELADDVNVHLDGGRTTPYDSPNSAYFFTLRQGWDNVICDVRLKPDATARECEKEWTRFLEQFREDKQSGYTFASKLIENHSINFYVDYLKRGTLIKMLADFIDKDPEVAKAVGETFDAVEKFSKGKDGVKFHIWRREDNENTPCIKFGLWDKSGEHKEGKKHAKRSGYSDRYRKMNVKEFIAQTLISRDADSKTKIETLKEFNNKIGQES